MTLHIIDGAAQERAKYAEIWGLEEYRAAHSPGLESVDHFMSVIKPRPLSTLIDIGCGSGAAGLEFKRRGLLVNWLDITEAGLDDGVNRLAFYERPLWSNWSGEWDYGFCCDVLEHIPPEYTMLVVGPDHQRVPGVLAADCPAA